MKMCDYGKTESEKNDSTETDTDGDHNQILENRAFICPTDKRSIIDNEEETVSDR